MAVYIDSADRERVESLLALGIFAGVTTNPTILERAHVPQDAHREVYAWADAAGAGEIFFQARGTSRAALREHGLALAQIGPKVIVKLPATREGIGATADLVSAGHPTLVTAVYHPAQALVAQAAGARFIAPYVGRMTDQGRDGVRSAIQMATMLAGTECRVIAASLRGADDVASLAAGGVPDFTMSADLCEALLADSLTVEAAEAFERAGADS